MRRYGGYRAAPRLTLSGVREFMTRLGVPYEVIETNAGR